MAGETALEIVLQLEPGPPGGPIRGRLSDGRGGETSFQGWLELTAAIESARAALQPSEEGAI
jgi:hypothetical protein